MRRCMTLGDVAGGTRDMAWGRSHNEPDARRTLRGSCAKPRHARRGACAERWPRLTSTTATSSARSIVPDLSTSMLRKNSSICSTWPMSASPCVISARSTVPSPLVSHPRSTALTLFLRKSSPSRVWNVCFSLSLATRSSSSSSAFSTMRSACRRVCVCAVRAAT